MWEISNKWGGGGEVWGEEGGDEGGGLRGIGGGMTSATHQMLNTCSTKSPGNPGKHTNLGLFGGWADGRGVYWLESNRAGSQTL